MGTNGKCVTRSEPATWPICNNLDVLSAVRRSQQSYGLPNRAATRRSGLSFLSHIRMIEVTNCDLNPKGRRWSSHCFTPIQIQSFAGVRDSTLCRKSEENDYSSPSRFV